MIVTIIEVISRREESKIVVHEVAHGAVRTPYQHDVKHEVEAKHEVGTTLMIREAEVICADNTVA
jgi:hypothetical protein